MSAKNKASEAIKEFGVQLEEMEEAMNDFREAKKGIDEKKKLAKEKIQRLKQ